MTGDVRLAPDQLERLAELIAGRVSAPTRRLVGVREVAEYLGVQRSFVYEHAVELGARRLGSGPKAPLRFSLREVDERLRSCPTGRESEASASPVVKPNRHRRRAARLGTGVELLPVKGGRRPLKALSQARG